MKSLVFQNNEYSRIIKIVESFDDEAKLAVVEYLKILYLDHPSLLLFFLTQL
jgi:hypothetical protein